MVDKVVSKNGKLIRLTSERWSHITEEHCELAGMKLEILESIANPSRILFGNDGELLAIRELIAGKFLVTVYREIDEDGFVITAFLTRKTRSLETRQQLWP